MLCSIDHITSIACAIAVITLGTWIQSSGAKDYKCDWVLTECILRVDPKLESKKIQTFLSMLVAMFFVIQKAYGTSLAGKLLPRLHMPHSMLCSSAVQLLLMHVHG